MDRQAFTIRLPVYGTTCARITAVTVLMDCRYINRYRLYDVGEVGKETAINCTLFDEGQGVGCALRYSSHDRLDEART